MSEVRVNNLSNENNTGGPTISGITTYSGRHFFVPPQGDTASRPEDCEPGSLRFNPDSAHLEYFRGNTIGWVEIEAELASDVLGGGTGSNTGLGYRGLIGGGNPTTSDVQFLTISTLGDTQDFGDLSVARRTLQGCASRTRALFCGGYSTSNVVDFHEFASTGNFTDFGDFNSSGRFHLMSTSSETRGLVAGGVPSPTNVIDMFTIASTGDGIDFGDLTTTLAYGGAMSSSTRSMFTGNDSGNQNTICFVITSTQGNATDFGDVSVQKTSAQGGGNATRGIIAGGNLQPSNSYTNQIDFITLATTGNGIDFGDLTSARGFNANMDSPTRTVFGGGYNDTDTIDFIQTATTGNAVDFGNMTADSGGNAGVSNGHGGL